MVSPLQTWHHPEPKRLWFILGGLSILAHIGLLGLSLPYMLRLMEQPSAAVSTLPIELVTVDPVSGQPIENADSESFSASANSTAQPEAATATSPPLSNSDDSNPPTESGSFSNRAPESSPTPSNSSITSATSDPATSLAPTPPPASRRPNRPSPPPTGTEPSSDSNSDSGSSGGSGDGSGNASDNSSSDGSDDSLPSLPGSGPLQPPGSEGTSTTVQVAALRVTGTRLDAVQDVKDQPPQLLSSTAAIALEPEQVGCDRLDFSSGPLGPLTYRVAIDADSSIQTLTLQAESGSSISPANAEAITCLIRSAGFTFSAAVSDGTPILDDSLLLTLDVIESQSNTAP